MSVECRLGDVVLDHSNRLSVPRLGDKGPVHWPDGRLELYRVRAVQHPTIAVDPPRLDYDSLTDAAKEVGQVHLEVVPSPEPRGGAL